MKTSNILASLQYIDEACTESTIDVSNALIDSYMKQAEMISISKQTGIVMEGFEYKEGENILKTIFLYIPRLIVAIIKEIKRRWDIYAKKKRLTKSIEKLEKISNQLYAFGDEFMKADVQRQWPHVEIVGNEEIVVVVSSRVKDFGKVKEFYEFITDAFKKYEAAAKAALGTGTVDFSGFNTVAHANIKDASDIIADTPVTRFLSSDESKEQISELIKSSDAANKTIMNSMKAVEDWWNDAHKIINADASNLASMTDRVLSDVRTLRDLFVNVNAAIYEELTQIENDVNSANKTIENYLNTENQKRRNELKDEIDKTSKEFHEEEKNNTKLANELKELEDNSPLSQFIPDLTTDKEKANDNK